MGEGLVAILDLFGFAAAHVETPTAALSAIEADPPDAIVLDVNLGASSGIDLYHEISAAWPDLAVILATGQLAPHGLPPPSSRLRVLFKPFDSDALLAALAALGVGEGE